MFSACAHRRQRELNDRPKHATTDLDDRQLGVPCHRAREVVRRIPEHAVPDLVDLPRSDEGDVARDGRLEHEPSAVELARLLLDSRNRDPGLDAARFQSEGDGTLLDCGVCARGREDGGETRCMCVQPSDKRALGDEFQRDLAVQVQRLEVLVSMGAYSEKFVSWVRAVGSVPSNI